MCTLVIDSQPADALLIKICGSEDTTYLAGKLEGLLVAPSRSSVWTPEGEVQLHLDDAHVAPEGAPITPSPGVRKIAALLGAARLAARWLVVELEYFDLDYRSEFSATHETAFGVRRANCSRLHFFGPDDDLRPPLTLRKWISDARGQYLGYAVVRPQVPGTIGRSLISPRIAATKSADATTPVWLPEGDELAARVRTAVAEAVELLGVPLVVAGVPFMEQDGYLLTCAHVSSWICHYTAVLKGVVPRQPTASFHLADRTTTTYGRRYPSSGLALTVLGGTLRSVDLPAEFLETPTLLDNRTLEWHDRPELKAALAERDGAAPTTAHDEAFGQRNERATADSGPAAAGEDAVYDEAREQELANWRDSFWLAENLAATVCRYVNSGIPVILAEEIDEHTRVICGYVRYDDDRAHNPVETATDLFTLPGAGVGSFIFQNDQGVPYEVQSITDIVGRAIRMENSTLPTLLVPLPTGIWMSGSTAERLGAEIFRYFILSRSQDLEAWLTGESITDGDQYRKHHMDLRAAVEDDTGKYSLRTYVTSGSSYKVGLATRVGIADTFADTVASTHLPKFVWVVELIERETRRARADESFVVGTVLLDASIVEDADDPERWASPLVVHVGGAVASIKRPLDNMPWLPTSVDPYASGRWRGQDPRDGLMAGWMNWKGAISRNPGGP